jgi:hypothetical protein
MAELRQEHLGGGLPPGPSVRAEMEAAYQRVVAERETTRRGRQSPPGDAVTAPFSWRKSTNEALEQYTMASGMNPALRRRLASFALGGLIALTAAPTAMAQWPPPWRVLPAGVITGLLNAQGYVLIAPLQRLPGVYLADVRAEPGGYQRLVIDDRSGEILEYFMSPRRGSRPEITSRHDQFRGPGSGSVSQRPKPQPATAATARKTPSATAGPAAAPAVAAPPQPPAPREAAKPDESTPTAPKPEPRTAPSPGETGDASTVVAPAAKPEPVKLGPPKLEGQTQRLDSAPDSLTEPPAPASSGEASRKSKISIVPAPLFQ